MSQTILVIEDQDDIATLAQYILESAGYAVLLAGSGEDGLRLLETQSVDLLLLDLMLPGIDGWEVLQRLRASATWADLPVLLFTVCHARLTDDHPELSLANGMIAKPFERQVMLATIARTLATGPVAATAR
jgi:two-component system copper resistance phosphate regulon response regulator CusR